MQGVVAVLFLAHVEEFAAVGRPASTPSSTSTVFQRLFSRPEFLGAFGVVPDLRVFQFFVEEGQALTLVIVVKDTSELATALGNVGEPVGDRIELVLLPMGSGRGKMNREL